VDQEFLSFIDELGSIDDPGALQDRTSDFLAERGFDKFSYVGFSPPTADAKAAVASTYPAEWLKHYTDNNYIFLDPAVTHARRSRKPIAWTSDSDLRHLGRSQRKVILEGHDFGIKNFVSVPIHGPSGEFAFFVASSGLSEKEYVDLVRYRTYELHLIGIHYHSAFFDQILTKPEAEEPSLTPRECECLLWAARGKSAWETGEILHISVDTARSHIKSACRKLSTGSKIHAVVKAIMLGCISP
jgi:DNA-binding CsgD family transcriptional regulator